MAPEGRIERFLREKSSERALLAALVDPATVDLESLDSVVRGIDEGGADLIFIGGSIATGVDLQRIVEKTKTLSSLPLILFPGNVDGVVGGADAILFMSLLNSFNPYWIIGAQALAAPRVRYHGLEAIPTAYLIFEPGERTTAGWVGFVNPLLRDRPGIAVAYATAAELLGIRWVYLEAGSGSDEPIPVEVISAIKKKTNLGIIVGGGLRTPEAVLERSKAGASVIVVGTQIERSDEVSDEIRRLVKPLKEKPAE